MRVVVVDTSGLGALVFGEPGSGDMAGRLSDVRMIAPSLLWFELANVCIKKIKAHPELKEKLSDAFRFARNLPIEIVEVDYKEVVELAMTTKLTAYDASYLWLAGSIGADLVTMDRFLLETVKHFPNSVGDR
jgi:predicted nucleic acid-binding protein